MFENVTISTQWNELFSRWKMHILRVIFRHEKP